MLQKSTVKETNVEKQFFCIKVSFLEPKNFKLMYENALKLNKTYEMYAQTIQNYFKAFHQYCSHIKEPTQQKIMFLYHFKKYLFDYSKIMARITDYQISCFETIRSNTNDESLSMALHMVIQNTKKYTPGQKEIRQKKQALTKQFTAIKGEYMNLQKKMKKPRYFYDRKLMLSEFQTLKSKISANQKDQQAILSQLIKIDQNSRNFGVQIDQFRKQLLKNKYKYHKKFVDLAINTKESLAQLFYYQYNCLNDYYQTIMNAMKNSDDQFSMMRADKSYRNLTADASGCIGVIIKNTEEFLNLLLSIQNDLKTTEKNFEMINKRLKQYQEKGLTKTSFQYINKYFESDQNPGQIILETMSAFDYCFRKLSQKQTDCKIAAQQIENIRKQITKHKGITISLLKVKLKNGGLETVKNIMSQHNGNDQCGVYEFMNSLDLKPVKIVIKNCLDKMLFTFSEILTFFSQKTNSNRKLGIGDSMQLSYMEKSLVQVKKKRPVKDQLWLWDDHKKKVDTQFTLSKQLFNEIFGIYESFKDNGEINLDLEKYPCFSEQIDEVGQLCLSKKTIKFTSKTSDKQLCIPLKDIQEVKRKTKIVIKDSLHIKTKIGELVFRQFQNTGQAEMALKELVQSGGVVKGKIEKRPKIELTDAERKAIQSPTRKQQVQKTRPSITDFQQVQTVVFQQFPIDQVYDLILSDKKYNLTGKQHDSFLVYAMKKMNNKDFKITKFQPPGPKYYTLDQNTTFENGPIVSECKYDYNHILNMPFMPDECGNHETRKVFWINDKQLDYMIHAQTSGVPLSQNFYVQLIYKIKEENQNTTLKVYAAIKFLKSFALKSTVESSTWKEIKEGTKGTLAEMQKAVNLYKTLLSGKDVQVEEELQTEGKDPKKQLQNLKKRNMYLMIAVGIIILLNIIFKIFF